MLCPHGHTSADVVHAHCRRRVGTSIERHLLRFAVGATGVNMESTTAASAYRPAFPPLAQETRLTVDTACAAYHLCRQPQTLRGWACHEDGPLRPLRIHGRLAWKVIDLRRLNGMSPD